MKTDDVFGRERQDISTQDPMGRLLKKEGIACIAEELPGVLAYLEGWRERTHALPGEKLEALTMFFLALCSRGRFHGCCAAMRGGGAFTFCARGETRAVARGEAGRLVVGETCYHR